MAWPIRVQIIIIDIFLFAVFAFVFRDVIRSIKTTADLPFPVFFFLFLVTIMSAMIIQHFRELRLLQYGNCVMGRVVDKIKAGAGRRRRALIVYQFAVGPGKPMTAKGVDYKSCSINSPVLVFFDPGRLESHVALCSTGWRVCDETSRPIEP